MREKIGNTVMGVGVFIGIMTNVIYVFYHWSNKSMDITAWAIVGSAALSMIGAGLLYPGEKKTGS